ncbi:hypothetical protein GGF32_009048 [Allomyces javanicus]|nr:hypothetical protein GGF32_009048 [Allomyces javanicus]
MSISRKALSVLSPSELRMLNTAIRASKGPKGPELFTVTRNTNTGHWNKPKFSLRKQASIRKATMLAPLAGVKEPVFVPLPALPTERKPLRTKLPKGTKADRTKAKREEAVTEKLAQMEKTLEAWRNAKRAEKLKAKPDLPF